VGLGALDFRHCAGSWQRIMLGALKAAPLQIRCPKCDCEKVRSLGKRYALYPAGCVVLLPLVVAWVHRCSSPYEFECGGCGRRFARRTLAAKVALVGTWLLVGLAVWFLISLW
jgi:hypothetical protein